MTATISPCGQYRYTLTRPAKQLNPTGVSAVFCMLNPSTADATEDDPTIRRCRGFSERWDCNGIVVVNLYALRSTDPKGLWRHPDPIGPENRFWLDRIAREFGDVVCAWGANARPEHVEEAVALFRIARARLWCLGTTRSGAPRHPLYVRGDQPLVRWSPLK